MNTYTLEQIMEKYRALPDVLPCGTEKEIIRVTYDTSLKETYSILVRKRVDGDQEWFTWEEYERVSPTMPFQYLGKEEYGDVNYPRRKQ